MCALAICQHGHFHRPLLWFCLFFFLSYPRFYIFFHAHAHPLWVFSHSLIRCSLAPFARHFHTPFAYYSLNHQSYAPFFFNAPACSISRCCPMTARHCPTIFFPYLFSLWCQACFTPISPLSAQPTCYFGITLSFVYLFFTHVNTLLILNYFFYFIFFTLALCTIFLFLILADRWMIPFPLVTYNNYYLRYHIHCHNLPCEWFSSSSRAARAKFF